MSIDWSDPAQVLAFKRERPFSNGSEFEWWNNRNCNRCTKYVYWQNPDGSRVPDEDLCPIEMAISMAAAGIAIPEPIAARLGLDHKWNGADCLERELLPQGETQGLEIATVAMIEEDGTETIIWRAPEPPSTPHADTPEEHTP